MRTANAPAMTPPTHRPALTLNALKRPATASSSILISGISFIRISDSDMQYPLVMPKRITDIIENKSDCTIQPAAAIHSNGMRVVRITSDCQKFDGVK